MVPLLCLGGALFACAEQSEGTSADRAHEAVPGTGAPSYASIYADERIWPVRVWLEEPLLDEGGEILVPARRMGVLVHLDADGQARVDFGRFGPHTVPASQTNLVAEAARVRSGEASKPLPNLVGMLSTRLIDVTSSEPKAAVVPWDGERDDRVLLVFADPFAEDMHAMEQLLSELRSSPELWQTVLVPISDESVGSVHTRLRSEAWTPPFVVTAIARSYVPAMLGSASPRPWLRLASANGRILVEGPPTQAVVAVIATALDATAR